MLFPGKMAAMTRSTKSTILTVTVGAACFSLGWWCSSSADAVFPARASDVLTKDTQVDASGIASGSLPSRDRRSSPSVERGNASLRSLKGGARAWLAAQAEGVAADSDPGAALRLAQSCLFLNESSASELVREIIRLQSSDDPETRARFRGVELDRLLEVSVFRLSQLNPDAALVLLGEMRAAKGDLLALVFSNVAAENLPSAKRYLESANGPALRDAVEPIAARLAVDDPQAAISLLEEFPQPELDSERRKLVERLVEKDPGRGIAVAVKFAHDGRNPDVVRAAVQRWLTVDEDAALQWAAAYRGPGETELREFLQKRENP